MFSSCLIKVAINISSSVEREEYKILASCQSFCHYLVQIQSIRRDFKNKIAKLGNFLGLKVNTFVKFLFQLQLGLGGLSDFKPSQSKQSKHAGGAPNTPNPQYS